MDWKWKTVTAERRIPRLATCHTYQTTVVKQLNAQRHQLLDQD